MILSIIFGRRIGWNDLGPHLLMVRTVHRHGWGIAQDPSLAITYLSQAASNSASVESHALSAGIKKGGAAKGELVLAIYELANCFRHGWGVGKDPVAARKYYETAANLGDTDAMNEAAWCYEEGFGGKRDKVSGAVWMTPSAALCLAWALEDDQRGKRIELRSEHLSSHVGQQCVREMRLTATFVQFAAAKWYRLAEGKGNKTVGNSWLVFSVPFALCPFANCMAFHLSRGKLNDWLPGRPGGWAFTFSSLLQVLHQTNEPVIGSGRKSTTQRNRHRRRASGILSGRM